MPSWREEIRAKAVSGCGQAGLELLTPYTIRPLTGPSCSQFCCSNPGDLGKDCGHFWASVFSAANKGVVQWLSTWAVWTHRVFEYGNGNASIIIRAVID